MSTRLSIVAVALIVAACSATPAQPPDSPPTAVQPTQTTARQTAEPVHTPAPSSTLTPGAMAAYGFQMVLLARADDWTLAFSDGTSAISSIPAGVPSANWDTVYSATVKDGKTRVDARFVEDTSYAQTWNLEGAWAIPTIGLARTPAGLSADGTTLVLVDAQPSANATHFAILGTQSSAPARIVSLSGRYTFDAISPDGSRIFVIEYHDAPAGYFVRSVNARTGVLDPGTIVDKRNLDEVMAGTALQQADGMNGTVLTLYQGPDHPFVHLLQTVDRTAWCIDLPDAWGDRQAAAAAWGTALSADLSTLFIANPMLGVAAQVDLNTLEVVRSASFAPSAGAVLAKFGGGTAGPTGAMVLSKDGATLYLADTSGVLLIPTSTLKAAAHILPGTAIVSLGMSDSGGVLYAVGRNGTAYRVDATDGHVIATLGGAGYTRVLRVITPN